MKYGITGILLAIYLISLCGCSTTPASPLISAAALDDGPSQRWRTTGDYYALLELVDAHIDPEWNGKVSKADVAKYLGEGIHDPDGYPNAGPNIRVYESTRAVQVGAYLFIRFTDDGFVKSVSWGSE
jgi:hypothetical protein